MCKSFRDNGKNGKQTSNHWGKNSCLGKRYTLAYERKAIQSHQDKGQHGNIFHSYMPIHQAPTKSILIFWELNDTEHW